MDGNMNNNGEGSQRFPAGGNAQSYPGVPGGWNPYMFGYQAPPAGWFPQGLLQFAGNANMTSPQSRFPQAHYGAATAATVPPTENEDQEVEVLATAPVEASPSSQRTSKVKLPNFGPAEDVFLVTSWLEISCDPIVGNGQKQDSLWRRIIQRYNLKRGSHPERSQRSLSSRWASIKAEVGKFASYYADVVRENPSGMSDADKTTRAAADYAEFQKQRFLFMHCWDIMKDEPKWKDPSQLDAAAEPIGDGLADGTENNENLCIVMLQSLDEGLGQCNLESVNRSYVSVQLVI